MRTPASARWFAGRLAKWRGVLGLNYHRIGDGRASLFDRGLWSATGDGFDKQVRYLKANFDVIGPDEIPDAVTSRRGRHVLVTFDDGYLDNYTVAFPILKSNGVKAAFFITTGFIDEPRLPWWDEIAWMVRTSDRSTLSIPAFLPATVQVDEPGRERAVLILLRACFALPSGQISTFLEAVAEATGTSRPPLQVADGGRLWMTWGMIREMHSAGMSIGGHTVSHPVLSQLSRDEQRAEIAGCERRIREELHIPMRTFAYPFGLQGSFNLDSRECLRELSVTTAFSYYGGFRRLSAWDYYDIPRIAVEQNLAFEEFRANVMFPWMT